MEEIHYSQTYIRVKKKQVFDAKTKELNSWKKTKCLFRRQRLRTALHISGMGYK